MNPFKECSRDDVKGLMEEYIQTLSSPIDSFLENHILNSKFYQIYAGSFMIGYFAIHNNEKMTQFYIRQSHLHLAQDTFKQVLECYFIRSLFVPTCDELFWVWRWIRILRSKSRLISFRTVNNRGRQKVFIPAGVPAGKRRGCS